MKKESKDIEIGIYTFGELLPDPHTGQTKSAHQRLKDVISAAKLADEGGLDVFGVGEHHRPDFALTSPAVTLAAISQVTNQIKLTSATTVLSTTDPVRLFEDFASLDLLSGGRAEIMAGRGAYIEPFTLFGYDLNDYQRLYAENMELLLLLNEKINITWNGNFRSSLRQAEIAPRPIQGKLPIWTAVGLSPDGAEMAGRSGSGLALALLGNDPAEFKPIVENYKKAGSSSGYNPDELKIAVTSHGYIANTASEAMDEFYPYYANYFKKYIKSRQPIKMSRELFEQMASKKQGLFVGSPQEIVEKMLYQHELLGNRRFLLQIDIGGQPFSSVAKSIELLAGNVAPAVRQQVKNRNNDQS